MSPSGACASTRKPSDIGAEQNHLCPVSSYVPSSASGVARVVLARTSLPPCFSVMPIPNSAPGLRGGGPQPRVVDRRGQPRLPLGGQRRVGAQRGHRRVRHRQRAAVARLDLRPHQERGRAPQMPAGPRPGVGQPRRRRPCRAAGARTDGTRPRRCGGRSGRGCAASAGSRSPARPTPAPGRNRRPGRAPPSSSRTSASSAGSRCRSTASVRARSAAKTSYPTRGGAWLVTVWVVAAMTDTVRTCTRQKKHPNGHAEADSTGPAPSTATSRSAGPPGCCSRTPSTRAWSTGSWGSRPRRRSSRCCPCRRCCSA